MVNELREVMSVHQSPMNGKRWLLVLRCGHEVWVTSSRRPTRQAAKCPQCWQKVEVLKAEKKE